MGIGLKDLWLSLRVDMVHSGSYPPKIDMIRKNLAGSRNVFAEDNEERAAWVEDMRNAPDDGLVKDHAEVVYFTGCVAAYFPMAQKIATALAEIMIACEVDFTLMGENEWCCGFPLLGAGLKLPAQELTFLGGLMSKSNLGQTSFSWQVDYRQDFYRHFAASIAYINEGHVPGRHRDGTA